MYLKNHSKFALLLACIILALAAACAPTPVPTDTAPLDTPTPFDATATPPLTAPASETVASGQSVDVASTPATSVTVPAPSTGANTCFGSINGTVYDDRNQNRQADPGEAGLAGSVLVLKNSANAIVAVYTTGSGQFDFPGLPAGTYTLSETPPNGYAAGESGPIAVEVKCGATATENRFDFIANSTPEPMATATMTATLAPTDTPAPATTAAPTTPRPTVPPSSANSSGPASSGVPAINPGGAVQYISGCTSITSPGTYALTTSLVSQWDCIQVLSDNVVLDCQNNSLNGTDFNGYGVVVHKIGFPFQRGPQNVEIKNCNIAKHKYGIFVDAGSNFYIHNNQLVGNFTDVDSRRYGVFLGLPEGGGLRLNSLNGGRVDSNVVNSNAIGVDIRNSNNLVITRNTTSDNTAWGVHLYNVHASEVSYNTANDNIRYCTWGNGTVGAGCDAGGIMLQGGSSGINVHHNQVGSGNGNGIFIKAHDQPCGNDNTIAYNHITNVLYNGIELSFCQNNKILGNEIDHSMDGIWLGFASNTTVNAGNNVHDINNHGFISWNSQDNTVSDNTFTNDREGIYLYSSDYKKEEFYFVPGSPADHVAQGNYFGTNTLQNNSYAAVHFSNAVKNQVKGNTLRGNAKNFFLEGNSGGNVIDGNNVSGGTYVPALRHLAAPWPLANLVPEVHAPGIDLAGDMLLRALQPDASDSVDLAWFKAKLRVSLFQ